jgi:hypothetical protein
MEDWDILHFVLRQILYYKYDAKNAQMTLKLPSSSIWLAYISRNIECICQTE